MENRGDNSMSDEIIILIIVFVVVLIFAAVFGNILYIKSKKGTAKEETSNNKRYGIKITILGVASALLGVAVIILAVLSVSQTNEINRLKADFYSLPAEVRLSDEEALYSYIQNVVEEEFEQCADCEVCNGNTR